MITSLITGITGQCGSYLAEMLLAKDHHVIGMARRCAHTNTERIKHLLNHQHFHLVEGDVTDSFSIINILREYRPDFIYHLAGQSHVHTSFTNPITTFEITGGGTLNILEAIRHELPACRFYNAATSEMFGDQFSKKIISDENHNLEIELFQDEETPMHPQSPYGVAKLAGYHLTRLYREGYGLFNCSGILFNNESPRRGDNFVTRKITKYIGRLLKAIEVHQSYPKLKLGNLESSRDFGYSKDYCRAIILILEHDIPDDYIIATGITHTIREFAQEAFGYVDLDYNDWIEIDQSLIRPSEVPFLRGCADKAHKVLGWYPEVQFEELVHLMVDADRLI